MLNKLNRRQGSQGVELHPHSWSFQDPSSKRAKAKRFRSRSSDDLAIVPAQSIFRDVALPYALTPGSTAPPSFEQYPTPGHIASHLLLIECFHELRASVETSTVLEKALEARQSRKLPGVIQTTWSAYLDLAITRFKLWITKIESVIRHSANFNRYGTGSHLHGAFTPDYLPPIDIMLIWYCYLQSPAAYERLIASNEFTLLSQICFPWHILPVAIDQTTLEYRRSLAADALWKTLIRIPNDLEDCIGVQLVNDTAAFTSHSEEILDFALQQTDFIERIHPYQWLRSPALRGTIQRGMSRYAREVTCQQVQSHRATQQVPIDVTETRTIAEMNLDLVVRLVLNTHRAFYSAWQVFAQQNGIHNDDQPPPPAYNETHKNRQTADTPDIPSSEACYCWICERVKDDMEAITARPQMSILAPVVSPDEIDEKRSIVSSSSSDADEPPSHSGLSRKQIRQIKAEVSTYRHIEANRQQNLRKASG